MWRTKRMVWGGEIIGTFITEEERSLIQLEFEKAKESCERGEETWASPISWKYKLGVTSSDFMNNWVRLEGFEMRWLLLIQDMGLEEGGGGLVSLDAMCEANKKVLAARGKRHW